MTTKSYGDSSMIGQMRFLCGAGRQRGIALIIGLIILAVLSLIGVAAFSVSTQEERMAGNSRDRIRAFEAAEAALRHCEAYVASGNAQFNGQDGTYTAPPSPQPSNTEGINWSNPGNTVQIVPTTEVQNPDWFQQPVCVAEQFQVQNKPVLSSAVTMTSVAHVTAQGYGSNPNTIVKLESYYAMN